MANPGIHAELALGLIFLRTETTMNPLVLTCDLNAQDSLTLRLGFKSMPSVWIRAQQGRKIVFILLGPASVRALHAHLSAFVQANEDGSNGPKETRSPAIRVTIQKGTHRQFVKCESPSQGNLICKSRGETQNENAV